MIGTLAQVALGGAIGASARWGLDRWITHIAGPGFPLGVMFCNVIGSLLMGLFIVTAAHKGLTQLSPLIATGLLGGFTTFSAFSLEAVNLMERGEATQALAYVGLSVGASLGGLYAGMMIARGLFA